MEDFCMKYGFIAVAASLLLVVAGCGNRADAEDSSTQPTQESVAETGTSSSEQELEGVPEMSDITYTAVLAEDARVDQDTVSLSLTDVSSEDEAGLQEDLILNLEDTQVSEIQDSLQKGTKIEFTLAGNAVMTFSIPPQIPGSSVLAIKIAD
ncbi:hypothetical protein D920_02028 [Enterococcus faecalis 13-SD-W-01]|nr:hypothetical protein D920_02028 [Enterococcus faecalis 13-SD-W-01]